MPGLLKIGLTSNVPSKRASELYTTGVPTPFEVERAWKVPGSELSAIESEIHSLLQRYRYNHQREFFELEQDEAIDVVGAYIKRRPGSLSNATLSRTSVYGLLIIVVGLLGSMMVLFR